MLELDVHDLGDKDIDDLLTPQEIDVLMNMIDKCEEMRHVSRDSNYDGCDHAFELEKCWKRADPNVSQCNSI